MGSEYMLLRLVMLKLKRKKKTTLCLLHFLKEFAVGHYNRPSADYRLLRANQRLILDCFDTTRDYFLQRGCSGEFNWTYSINAVRHNM